MGNAYNKGAGHFAGPDGKNLFSIRRGFCKKKSRTKNVENHNYSLKKVRGISHADHYESNIPPEQKLTNYLQGRRRVPFD